MVEGENPLSLVPYRAPLATRWVREWSESGPASRRSRPAWGEQKSLTAGGNGGNGGRAGSESWRTGSGNPLSSRCRDGHRRGACRATPTRRLAGCPRSIGAARPIKHVGSVWRTSLLCRATSLTPSKWSPLRATVEASPFPCTPRIDVQGGAQDLHPTPTNEVGAVWHRGDQPRTGKRRDPDDGDRSAGRRTPVGIDPRTAAGPVPPAFPTQQVQNMFRRMFSTKSGASVPAAH